MIAFAREPVASVVEEIKPLLALHYHEIAHFQDIPLDPDWEFYLRAPMVRVFTARHGHELVGYGVFFVAPNKHYRSSLQAVQDILFVHPEHRGMTGFRLLRYCDRQLRAEGVQVVYHHVKLAHDFGGLLKAMKYEPTDMLWAKRLDKE